MFAIEIDLAGKFGELAVGSSEKLVHIETNGRAVLIELVSLICERACSQADNREDCADHWVFHIDVSFALVFVCGDKVFKSGVRESGSLPKRFPRAKAGSTLNLFSWCTPVIRASSVSKWETARRFESLPSR